MSARGWAAPGGSPNRRLSAARPTQSGFARSLLLRLAWVSLVLSAQLACGARSTSDFDYEIDPPAPVPALPEECGSPQGTCSTRRCDPPLLSASHVPVCSKLTFASNPPTSGPHYPIWGLFKNYATPLARGFYLHDAEHSGIVLLYNCDYLKSQAECDTMVDAMTAYVAAKPSDSKCALPTRNRFIVTPDAELDVAYAAVAWGHSLKAACFDAAATDTFSEKHYGQNYEDLCGGGLDPTDPGAGLTKGCGLF